MIICSEASRFPLSLKGQTCPCISHACSLKWLSCYCRDLAGADMDGQLPSELTQCTALAEL